MACPPILGPLEMRESCRIAAGGSKGENEEVLGSTSVPDSPGGRLGVPVTTPAREHGVSPATIHRWKSKYGGMTLSEMKRLRALEEENARLKRIVAQQALDNELLREINAKKW